ncbi:hypothetical protein BT93_C1281 [Corymbia citriodora subsp. variegata]|nr:hypothetical protein BT93_C1281 [Corymbia citriodora subsp. variegata]
MDSKICLLLFSVLVLANGPASSHAQEKDFNVRNLGAVADGKTDDSKAFLEAWNQACQYEGGDRRLFIPSGTYLVWPVEFKGPCTGHITVTLEGLVKAPTDESTFSQDNWIRFQYIDRLTINGNGTLDGEGPSAWPSNECGCKTLPQSVRISSVNNTLIQSITSLNSKSFHFNVFSSNDVEFRDVKIIAPDESPNTDGIHIGDASRVKVTNCDIRTGDDCVSVGPGSKDIAVTGVHCGPGHGFSVGSLGKYEDEGDVSGLSVRDCTMESTQNGVRIKTWVSQLKSSAYGIEFVNIEMKNVTNPIIIDQVYCPGGGCSTEVHV